MRSAQSPRQRPVPVPAMPTSWSPPRKPFKYYSPTCSSSRLALITALLLLVIPALVGFTFRLNPFLSHSLQVPTFFPPSLCLAVTDQQHFPPWTFNSRALCVSSAVCIRNDDPFSTYIHAADRRATKCATARPDWSPVWHPQHNLTAEFQSCTDFEHSKVICAHGPGLDIDQPQCPPRVLPATYQVLRDADWLEHLTILVPAYPWPENIFHFANVMASLSATVHALPTLLEAWGLTNVRAPGGLGTYFDGRRQLTHVNVLFQGSKDLIERNIWQNDLLDVTLKHVLTRGGVNVTARWLVPGNDANQHTCMRNAVVMGRRGDINVFPFANASAVPVDGRSVPWDAVSFKKAMYAAYGIQARLPEGDYGIVELPPLTLGYAKRADERSKIQGFNVLPEGIFRKFSPTDEKWFQDMLREETGRAGVSLRIFTISGDEPLRDQVTNIAKVGFVVGIHGANLVNAMFMNPFGALLEISPASVFSPCYIGGMNSGLAYMRYESSQMATPEESGCTQKDKECQEQERYRMVKMGAKVDRDSVRELVQEGIRRLRYLHATYPRGIPVVFNKESGTYEIKERR